MASKDEIEILELSIKELQIKCEQINGSHDQLRVRVLAMLTVLIALANYVFKGVHLSIMDGAEKFLFGFGAFLLVCVFCIMLKLTATRGWEMAVELKEIERAYSIRKTKLAYLRYMQKDYLTAVKGNMGRVQTTAWLFNACLYVLSFSAILLLALKR